MYEIKERIVPENFYVLKNFKFPNERNMRLKKTTNNDCNIVHC